MTPISAKYVPGRDRIDIHGIGNENTSYGISIGKAYALKAFLEDAISDWEKEREELNKKLEKLQEG